MKVSKKSKRDAAFNRLEAAAAFKKQRMDKKIALFLIGLTAFFSNTIVKIVVLIISAYFVGYWAIVAIHAPIKYFIELW